MDNALSLKNPFASVTLTVILLVPAVAGVPLITPLPLFKLNPAGNTPTVIDQPSGILPPVAVNVVPYNRSTVPSGSEAVVTVSVA